jgi:hypothetical protein
MKMKKLFVTGIIFLFIGVAVAPSINSSVVKASNDDDLIEVTSQTCGIQGFGNTTVKLTKEQYQNLEQYLVTFRARLNQTTTREEAVPLFKEAVAEVNTYGLLPKGMSVKQAQKLVTSRYVNHQGFRFLETSSQRNALPQNDVDNLFCLVAGNTNNNFIFGPIKSSLFIGLLLLMDIVYVIAKLFDSLGLARVVTLCEAVDAFLGFLWLPVRVVPAEILGSVTFRNYYYEWEAGPHYYASNGWIYALGLRDAQSLNGSFYGTIRQGLLGFYYGLSGFTGIVIRPLGAGRMLFVGSAFRAGLSPNHL